MESTYNFHFRYLEGYGVNTSSYVRFSTPETLTNGHDNVIYNVKRT